MSAKEESGLGSERCGRYYWIVVMKADKVLRFGRTKRRRKAEPTGGKKK
jgi:hypothetical protein